MSGSLGEVFAAELARLEGATFAQWQSQVTGKAVLKVFRKSFPGANAEALLVNLYLNLHPTPPADLERLVQRILSPAGYSR